MQLQAKSMSADDTKFLEKWMDPINLHISFGICFGIRHDRMVNAGLKIMCFVSFNDSYDTV